MSSDSAAPSAVPGVVSDVVLSTERLLVRDWRATDAADAFEMFGDVEVTWYLGNPVPKRDLPRLYALVADPNIRYGREFLRYELVAPPTP